MMVCFPHPVNSDLSPSFRTRWIFLQTRHDCCGNMTTRRNGNWSAIRWASLFILMLLLQKWHLIHRLLLNWLFCIENPGNHLSRCMSQLQLWCHLVLPSYPASLPPSLPSSLTSLVKWVKWHSGEHAWVSQLKQQACYWRQRCVEEITEGACSAVSCGLRDPLSPQRLCQSFSAFLSSGEKQRLDQDHHPLKLYWWLLTLKGTVPKGACRAAVLQSEILWTVRVKLVAVRPSVRPRPRQSSFQFVSSWFYFSTSS